MLAGAKEPGIRKPDGSIYNIVFRFTNLVFDLGKLIY
jgi:hypothetical protein